MTAAEKILFAVTGFTVGVTFTCAVVARANARLNASLTAHRTHIADYAAHYPKLPTHTTETTS